VIIAVVLYPIIATVINSAQGEGRSFEIQFSAVVKHHVEDHLDTGFMQRFDGISKFIKRGLRRGLRGVTRLDGPQRQRVIAPVINEAETLQTRLAAEFRNRL